MLRRYVGLGKRRYRRVDIGIIRIRLESKSGPRIEGASTAERIGRGIAITVSLVNKNRPTRRGGTNQESRPCRRIVSERSHCDGKYFGYFGRFPTLRVRKSSMMSACTAVCTKSERFAPRAI